MGRFGKHPKEMQNRNIENIKKFENAVRVLIANLKINPFLTTDRKRMLTILYMEPLSASTLLVILTC